MSACSFRPSIANVRDELAGQHAAVDQTGDAQLPEPLDELVRGHKAPPMQVHVDQHDAERLVGWHTQLDGVVDAGEAVRPEELEVGSRFLRPARRRAVHEHLRQAIGVAVEDQPDRLAQQRL
jgi:hypothetical protein